MFIYDFNAEDGRIRSFLAKIFPFTSRFLCAILV